MSLVGFFWRREGGRGRARERIGKEGRREGFLEGANTSSVHGNYLAALSISLPFLSFLSFFFSLCANADFPFM